jgi:hypothetical protein
MFSMSVVLLWPNSTDELFYLIHVYYICSLWSENLIVGEKTDDWCFMDHDNFVTIVPVFIIVWKGYLWTMSYIFCSCRNKYC